MLTLVIKLKSSCFWLSNQKLVFTQKHLPQWINKVRQVPLQIEGTGKLFHLCTKTVSLVWQKLIKGTRCRFQVVTSTLSLPSCRFHLSLPHCRFNFKGEGTLLLDCHWEQRYTLREYYRGSVPFGIFNFVVSKMSFPSCPLHVVAVTCSLPRCRLYVLASMLFAICCVTLFASSPQDLFWSAVFLLKWCPFLWI